MKNKIKVNDLKIGDLVIGMRCYQDSVAGLYNNLVDGQPLLSCTTIAGRIKYRTKEKSGKVNYHVVGETLPRPGGEPVLLSGLLGDDEVEVIDQSMCKMILELIDTANQKLIIVAPYEEVLEMANKIEKIRHDEQQKLEVKYGKENS